MGFDAEAQQAVHSYRVIVLNSIEFHSRCLVPAALINASAPREAARKVASARAVAANPVRNAQRGVLVLRRRTAPRLAPSHASVVHRLSAS
ncbi:uncharacterized protein LOC119584239 isoform X2 [Penaeus monodon]|uniref:uncharacterized protein LOC119584239 isoform X2 n=1 Tax=Penaeus monodon TaxID=6687 RepID=UPI0018A7BA6F|nr:uncharacterized protein LOC119584239 isoform X2 [Penaeus monodon]